VVAHPATARELSNVRHINNGAGPPAVRITHAAVHAIAREALRSRDGLETGGILLGTDTHGNILISRAAGPGPQAHRTPHSFLRDLAHAQQFAAAAWNEDRSQWIGEWHTHPSSDLMPSELDLRSYLRHLHDPELHLDRFLAIIVGLTPDAGINTAVWLVERDRVRALPLAVTTPAAT
jgi:integrative and conjugative element protein (TIGR02256 family)